jgi:hypothetical protein
MKGHECNLLGTVNSDDNITFSKGNQKILSASMSELRDSWKGTLNGGGN